MNAASDGIWPWVALLGLGAYHGLNPAMGWLFAVALGLHRKSRGAVLVALAPIALGHAASVAAVLAGATLFGSLVDMRTFAHASGVLLLCWAAWHLVAGHRVPVRVGMQVGLAGLAAWSFIVATSHGAGAMLLPAVLSLCGPEAAGGLLDPGQSMPVALAALAVHTTAMLTAIAAISLVVYEWAGLAFLRRSWINLDAIWTVALGGSAAVLLAS